MKRRHRIRPRHVETLHLRPGDVLVFKPPGDLGMHEVEMLSEQLRQIAEPAGARAIVINRDASMSVIRREVAA